MLLTELGARGVRGHTLHWQDPEPFKGKVLWRQALPGFTSPSAVPNCNHQTWRAPPLSGGITNTHPTGGWPGPHSVLHCVLHPCRKCHPRCCLPLRHVVVLAVCKAGFGGEDCTECAAGSWANGTSMADCVTCPANTTTPEAGATSADDCSGEGPTVGRAAPQGLLITTAGLSKPRAVEASTWPLTHKGWHSQCGNTC
jgi:hypothetical protein